MISSILLRLAISTRSSCVLTHLPPWVCCRRCCCFVFFPHTIPPPIKIKKCINNIKVLSLLDIFFKSYNKIIFLGLVEAHAGLVSRSFGPSAWLAVLWLVVWDQAIGATSFDHQGLRCRPVAGPMLGRSFVLSVGCWIFDLMSDLVLELSIVFY